MTNKEKMRKAVEDARRWIATWPEWKKNILAQSGKSTCDVPRKPVVNK